MKVYLENQITHTQKKAPCITSSAISSVITTSDSCLRFLNTTLGILSNSRFVVLAFVGIKLAITNASTAAELFTEEEIELFIVETILVVELVDATELVSSSTSLGKLLLFGKLSRPQSMTDEDNVPGVIGVTIVIVVGFLTVLVSEVITDELLVGWYDDITELLVMEVVDFDLCQRRGLAEGPAKPIYNIYTHIS